MSKILDESVFGSPWFSLGLKFQLRLLLALNLSDHVPHLRIAFHYFSQSSPIVTLELVYQVIAI